MGAAACRGLRVLRLQMLSHGDGDGSQPGSDRAGLLGCSGQMSEWGWGWEPDLV